MNQNNGFQPQLHNRYYRVNIRVLASFLAILCFSIQAIGQNKGSIKGRIQSLNSQPLEFTNVYLKNSQKGTRTDGEGKYEINDLAPDTYQLVISRVGYQVQELSVKVQLGEVTVLPEIVLEEKGDVLQEVSIMGKRTNKFADNETDYVARMPLSNLENPQVYSTVNHLLMKEQIAVDMHAAIVNAPGTAVRTFPSGGTGVLLRGFSSGINARNGMETTSGRTRVEIANVERIEVLKGPSGTLFGASVSSFGGVVNLVTKKPFDTKRTEISYTTGSYGLHRLTADINTPLNEDKTVLFRLNTALHKEKSHLNYGYADVFLLAPSLVFKANEKLTFTLDAELIDLDNTRTMYSRFAPNSGVTNPNDFQLDYRTTLFHEDANAEALTTKVFAEAQYQLAPNWRSTTLFSFVGEEVGYSYQYYPT